jgi:hypothetical protein
LFLHPIPNPDQITDLYVNSDSESDPFSKNNQKLGNKIIKILGTDNGKVLLDIGCQNAATHSGMCSRHGGVDEFYP